MTKIDVELHDDVIEICNKIKSIEDTGIEINIPEGSVLFDSIVTIKLLKKVAQRDGKVLTITTTDAHGLTLLEMTEEGTASPTIPYEEYEPKLNILDKIKKFKIKNPFEGLQINFGVAPLILGIIFVLLGVGGYFIINKIHKASAKIVVEAQTLTRSVTVSVKKDTESNHENGILKGIVLSSTIEQGLSIETTGEKLVGNTAKGEVTIYNKTAEEKEFEEGEVLIFEESDKEYKYKILEDITVPARVDDEDPEAEVPTIYGEATVDIEALEIGDEYNIDGNETLAFDDHKKSDYIAKTKEDLSSGKKETKQAVSEEDLASLKTTLLETIKETMPNNLGDSAGKQNEYIKGSEYITIIEEEYSHESGEEAEEISLNQTAIADALAYSKKDLEDMLDEILKDLIPEGYVISEKDKDIKVEILGNSTNSVLNATQADLQATIKTYIVPDIDENKLKEDLRGKSLGDAQKTLGGIRNVKTYELTMFPNLPFIRKLPKDIEKISIDIQKD